MAIDIILIIFATWGFYIGYSRGIIKTIFAILSILFGLLAALRFAPAASDFLQAVFKSNNPLLFIGGFLLAFGLTMLLIRMFAKGLESILKTARINIINKLLGGVLIAGILTIVYSSILWFVVSAKIMNAETAAYDSITYPYLIELPGQVSTQAKNLKPVFVEFWERSVEMMDTLQKMSEKEVSEPSFYQIPADENSPDR